MLPAERPGPPASASGSVHTDLPAAGMVSCIDDIDLSNSYLA